MQILKVPYRKQISESACGVAAFEMAYRYIRPSKLSKFSQEKAHNKRAELSPDKTDMRVTTYDLIEMAQSRGLRSDWGRVDPFPLRLVGQVRYFTETAKIPLIACQQWHEDKTVGHFRVIVGIDEKEVVFHDPEPDVGGPECRLPLLEFIDAWRWSPGKNVTGGVGIWVAKHEIASPLGPDAPNPWALERTGRDSGFDE